MSLRPVYLDHNATTPLDPVVREAMLPWLGADWGNASSRHDYGRRARAAIDRAREQVAAAVGAHPSEVVFTSGGSEANNLLLKGYAARARIGALAISAVEHPCVREPARQLRRQGWQVLEVAVDAAGRVDPVAFEAVLDAGVQLVSVMHANNETGVLQDIAPLAACARARGVLMHSDCAQTLGKVAVDFRALGVHALSVSAHKLGGPLGAGALVADKRLDLAPLIAGGGQERGLRSGTENLSAIVGFGVAAERAAMHWAQRSERLARLRERLERGLVALGAQLFGTAAARLPNTSYFAWAEVDGETLVGRLDRLGYAVASGSACSSAQPAPSATLLAMGVAPELARGALRVSLGASNDERDIDGFLLCLEREIEELKRMAAIVV